ncbi:MAG: pyruvate kinase [Bacteroidales bacterium]|nr:pyruvate kinase [Bacteroidales bacterium]
MKKFMKTKIIATIGPASSSADVLDKMIDAGLDVCRLNFSHGNYNDHVEVMKVVRSLNETKGSMVALMADLQGPKIRLGDFSCESIPLIAGSKIIFSTRPMTGDAARVFISYASFAVDARPGETILVDDGKIALKVIATNGKDEVTLEALNEGLLFPRKGVNLPETSISLPSLTEKDLQDLAFLLDHDVQWIALSFVRNANDIIGLRKLINEHPSANKPRIIAKIEKPQAVADIEAIVESTDAIMIARGDLGVEVPMQQVPMIQKKIIKLCHRYGRPVIVATQMMEAMITNIRPTRAEVNDVANAVLDGADALMLSGETSVGRYPVETIQIMESIISQIEGYEDIYYQHHIPSNRTGKRFVSDSILFSACEMAQHTGAKAIVVVTHSGYSAVRLSSQRPKANLYVFSNDRHVLLSLSLLWGVEGFYLEDVESEDRLTEKIINVLKGRDLLKTDDLYINVLSTPEWSQGTSNTVRLGRV